MIEYYSLKKNGVCCSGKVIRLDKTFSRAGYVYTPWYEYTTETGEYFCKMCPSSTSFKNAFPVGRKIKIYYDKNDPEKHIIDKNTLYYNYSEIDDVKTQISDTDKAFSKSFYGIELQKKSNWQGQAGWGSDLSL